MLLSLEIPKKHLEEFSKLTDLDFALAHMVLNDKEYADFYKNQRESGRRVILDNGMHENGKVPLSVGEIVEAAKRINPSVVVPPDKLGDAQFTFDGFEAMRKHPGCDWDPALVIQGVTREERLKLFMTCRQFSNTLCLPYREPRTTWFTELIAGVPKHVMWPMYLHLFGMKADITEPGWFHTYCEQMRYPAHCVSIDTAKPIKWAIANKRMTDVQSLSGGGLLDHSAVMTLEHKLYAYYNIAYLRTLLI